MSLRYRVGAYVSLMNRYRETFSHHWKQRHQTDGKLFNAEESEFLPAVLSLQEKPVSPASRLVAGIMMIMVASAIVWSVFGKIDIIVNAAGKIIPGKYTKAIASVDVASVRAIHVEEGQQVKADDLLVELDSAAFDAEHDKAAGEAMEAILQMARSRALIEAVDSLKPPKFPGIPAVPEARWVSARAHLEAQYRDFRSKLARIDGEIDRFERELPLVARRAADYRELSGKGDISIHAYLEKEQARIDLEGQLEDARDQRTALIAETRRTAYDALAEGDKVAAASSQDALGAASHSRLLKLRSPIDGTVQQLNVHTVGGVVPAAQPLMMIVPRDGIIEVEAFLENKDIGFIREGQPAEVKVDTFDYTKYGTIPGRVSHVSHDSIQDEKRGLVYSVIVTLDKSTLNVDGREVRLRPGMSVEVEIKTGTRRVIEYVLSPLMQYGSESLHER